MPNMGKRSLNKDGVRKRAVQRSLHPTYGVFIIESYEEGPARSGQLDGQALRRMLNVCRVPHRYRFVRTPMGLKRAIADFRRSNYCFLHLSCHGNERHFQLQDRKVSFAQLAALVGPVLRDRRLFLSVCKAGRLELAERFITRYGCCSVLGTPNDICMDEAAVFWNTFYYFMNRVPGDTVRDHAMLAALRRMSRFFKQEWNFYSMRAGSTRLFEFSFSKGGSQRLFAHDVLEARHTAA
jgi:hypothetical protein